MLALDRRGEMDARSITVAESEYRQTLHAIEIAKSFTAI